MIGIGSLMKDGGWGMVGGAPVLVKAPDFCINFASAEMPFSVPRRTGRDRYGDAFSRILRYWLYLGQSRRMWVLVSSISSSQEQCVGSGDEGKKV